MQTLFYQKYVKHKKYQCSFRTCKSCSMQLLKDVFFTSEKTVGCRFHHLISGTTVGNWCIRFISGTNIGHWCIPLHFETVGRWCVPLYFRDQYRSLVYSYLFQGDHYRSVVYSYLFQGPLQVFGVFHFISETTVGSWCIPLYFRDHCRSLVHS